MEKVKWDWDVNASHQYNIFAKFEETLINFGILDFFIGILETEHFVDKYCKTKDHGHVR